MTLGKMRSAGAIIAAGLVGGLISYGSAAAAPGTYAIDPTHTFATFEIVLGGISTTRGRWDRKEGTVEFDRAARTGSVDLNIEMDSINTGVAAFDSFLKGADVFNIAAHPTARFLSQQFVFSGDKVTEVLGTLTLLGKSQPVTLKATRFNCYTNPIFKREVCGGDFVATVQRSQWGLVHGLPALAPDSVQLVIQIEAIRQ
jgi:polyisoprenoid-binding protein YceI